MIETARRHAKPNRRPASGSSRLRKPGFGGQASGAGPPPPFPVTRRVGNPGRSFLLPPATQGAAKEPDRRRRAGPPRCHRPPGAASGARRPSSTDSPGRGTARGQAPGGRHRNTRRRRPHAPRLPRVALSASSRAHRGRPGADRPRWRTGDGGPGDASVSTSTRNRATAAVRRIPDLRSRASSGCSRILEEPGEVPCSPVHDPGSERDFAPGLRAGTSHRDFAPAGPITADHRRTAPDLRRSGPDAAQPRRAGAEVPPPLPTPPHHPEIVRGSGYSEIYALSCR